MKILKYKNDGTTAITVNKTLTQISNNLYCYKEIDDYNNITYFYYIGSDSFYNPSKPNCYDFLT